MPKKGKLPPDIAANPDQTYAGGGWENWGDWLGTGTIAPRLRKYRSFREARDFARNLSFKSQKEWRDYCRGEMPKKGKLPPDIPAYPSGTYADKGWKGMGDWLGTGTTHLREYRVFSKARSFAHKLKLKNNQEWRAFCRGEIPEKGKLPLDIPANPDQTYAGGCWENWGDFLGTGAVASRIKVYRSFLEARDFARRLKLNSEAEWRAFWRGEMPNKGTRPADIPAKPQRTYADKGWKGMGDWLGTGTIAPRLRKYRSFREARNFARSLKLKSGMEWGAFCRGEMPEKGKLPPDIPAYPSGTYADKGWAGMGDWLGTGKARRIKGQK